MLSNTEMNISMNPHIWYKFHHEYLPSGQVQWTSREVKLDMHSKSADNRVYTKADHTLVLKRFGKSKSNVWKSRFIKLSIKD